jgi:hypothetical protein
MVLGWLVKDNDPLQNWLDCSQMQGILHPFQTCLYVSPVFLHASSLFNELLYQAIRFKVGHLQVVCIVWYLQGI